MNPWKTSSPAHILAWKWAKPFWDPPEAQSHHSHNRPRHQWLQRQRLISRYQQKSRSHFPCEGLRSEASLWIIPHRGKSLCFPARLILPRYRANLLQEKSSFEHVPGLYRKTRIFLRLKRSQESHSKPPSISGGPDRVHVFWIWDAKETKFLKFRQLG